MYIGSPDHVILSLASQSGVGTQTWSWQKVDSKSGSAFLCLSPANYQHLKTTARALISYPELSPSWS
ncbi:hypothetical protein AC578_2488 [Pseudocercospora eumusae]|uniref:Uncharacterized protein n=1 Tax=Pseudocercospora eumusae TaxID=321146 RepID=A0A139HXS4_9PEZI|nr:hypothetical protein AC578_2488 [Pseudocercospora eumusae]